MMRRMVMPRPEGGEQYGELYIHRAAAKGREGVEHVQMWLGKQSRPFYNYTVKAHQVDAEIAKKKAGHDAMAKRKADHQAARKAVAALPHTYKVGEILYNSWGWEQTNIDFYVVESTTPHSITLRRIASEIHAGEGISSMAGYSQAVEPVRILEGRDPLRKIVHGGDHVGMDHGSCHRWDGKPKYCSWYA